MLGDFYCDEICNKKEHNWDNGDCIEIKETKKCFNYLIGDGLCDKQCNI